jgi:hypothetical protein
MYLLSVSVVRFRLPGNDSLLVVHKVSNAILLSFLFKL